MNEEKQQQPEVTEASEGDQPIITEESLNTRGRATRFFEGVGLFFLEIIKVALLAGVTIGLVRYFLFKPFYVKGQSMESTFYQNEYLIIDEITYRFREPERGEVVVFASPGNPQDFFLKRVIGLPGERVKIDDSKVIIYNDAHPQGVVLEESYLDIGEMTDGAQNISLGADEYYVLGDNRDASFDSRRFGPIEVGSIVGRTWLRGYPFTRMGVLQSPEYNL